MTTATTAYRDYVVDKFADSLQGDEFNDLELPAWNQAIRASYRKTRNRLAQPTTIQRYFVIQFDSELRSGVELPPILKEPESELAIFVAHHPIKTRQVQVRITARTKGVPNPILPNFGE